MKLSQKGVTRELIQQNQDIPLVKIQTWKAYSEAAEKQIKQKTALLTEITSLPIDSEKITHETLTSLKSWLKKQDPGDFKDNKYNLSQIENMILSLSRNQTRRNIAEWGKIQFDKTFEPTEILPLVSLSKVVNAPSRRQESLGKTYLTAEKIITQHSKKWKLNPEDTKKLFYFIVYQDQDKRFFSDTKEPDFDPKDKMILFGNQNQKVSLDQFPEHVTKKFDKIHKQVMDDLVSLYQRPVTTFQMGKSTLVQQNAHIEMSEDGIVGKVVWNKTPSSESQKRKETPTENNCNLGVIQRDGEIMGLRTARPDDRQRIMELLMLGYLSSKNSSNQLGIIQDTDPPQFQLSLITALDLNLLKSVFVRNMKGKLNDERAALKEIKNILDQTWGSKKFIELTVIDEHGQPHSFHALKPLVKNIVMSGQSKKSNNLTNARESNLEDSHREFDLLRKSIPKKSSFYTAVETFSNLDAFFTGLKDIKVVDLTNEDKKIYLALLAAKINITGKDFQGKSLEKEYTPAFEAILNHILYATINVLPVDSCKSGNDRTLQLISLALAYVQTMEEDSPQKTLTIDENLELEEYKSKMSKRNQFLSDFKDLFQTDDRFTFNLMKNFETLSDKMGSPVLKANRGKAFVKWDRAIIPWYFLLHAVKPPKKLSKHESLSINDKNPHASLQIIH